MHQGRSQLLRKYLGERQCVPGLRAPQGCHAVLSKYPEVISQDKELCIVLLSWATTLCLL